MQSDDDKENGRILSDAEWARALKNRDDIFLIDNGKWLRIIVALFLAIDIMVCGWLSTAPPAKVAPDFLPGNAMERVAKLLNVPIKPAAHEQKVINQKRPWRRVIDLAWRAEKPGSAPGGRMSVGARAAANVKATAVFQSPAPKAAVPLPAPGVIRESGGGRDSGIVSRGNARTAEDSGLIYAGYAAKRQGSYAPAFAAFYQALKHDPRDTLALSGVGDLFLYSGLFDSALAFYHAALAVNPRMVAAHKGLGTARYYISTFVANPLYAKRMNIADPARYIKSQYDSAIAEYTTAISIDSSYVSALTDRGVLRDLGKDYDGAIKDYTRAIAINPSFADAYSKRAMTYRTLGRYREAIADYTAALKLGTGSYDYDPMLFYANVYFGRGVVYHKMGDLDNAIADFDSALAISPRHSLAILNKAIALSDAKRYDSAIAAYTLAIAWLGSGEYDGARYRSFLNRGDAYLAQGKFDKAIGDYTSALEFPALAAQACWRMAECHALRHDRKNAIAWLKKSVSFGFHDFGAWARDPTLSYLRGDKGFRDLIGLPR
jgi:tetratricopeptide (TPR) repeat protein